jgi:D-beta-D-heptose 7-phosphate kinase/D-beta-D-heptose 1-phosphate adenosyltransferase
MNNDLPGLIDRFAGLNVLVLGEAMLDSYLQGSAHRLAQEAPVPVVSLSRRMNLPGGAANAAAEVAALGGSVTLLSVVGDDLEAHLLREALTRRGVISDHLVTQHGRGTLAKQRLLADGQMLVRFDQGSTDPIDAGAEEALLDRLSALYAHCDAVIVSDYDYGVVTPRIVETLAELQARTPRLLVVDARDLRRYGQVGAIAVKPNYLEAMRLLNLRPAEGTKARAAQIAAEGERLLEITGAQLVAVTLDEDGGLFLERAVPPYRTFARPADGRDRVTGAGDTFAAALALSLAAGATTPTAAELASAASAVVIGKDGTATCTAAELRQYLWAGEKLVPDLKRITDCVAYHRAQGRRIVFTNGCFDILHRGHITYLNRAKALGDVLVLGVNSDESARRLKGPDRPINPLEDRIQVLAALSCVDYIVPFEEDRPDNVIRAVRPDLFVKGGDYTRDSLPEASLVEALGGNVQILPHLADHSTTEIVKRIHDLTGFTSSG